MKKTKSDSTYAMGQILKTSMPMMISQLIMTLSGFISALILSQVNLEVFSASMLISSVQLVISIVPYALLFCIGSIVSHIASAKQGIEQVGTIFRSTLWVALGISALLMLLLYFIEPLLLTFGQPERLVSITDSYFKVFIWGLPAVGFMRVATQILDGLFKQKITLMTSIVSLALSTFLGYGLVFGCWGFPKLGVPGLAWGFVIQVYLLDLLLLAYLFFSGSFVPYKLFKFDPLKTVIATQKKLFEIGGPIVLQTGNELLSFFATTLMVGWLGTTALMAKQVAVRYLMLLVIPLFGLSQAAALFSGKYYGAEQFNEVKSFTRHIVAVGLIYTVAVVLVFAIIPEPFIRVFVSHSDGTPSFYHLVSWLLVLVALGQVFDSLKVIYAGALRGLQDTKYTMQVSLVFVWPVGLGLAYLFGFTLRWGLIGMTVAHLIATAIAAALIYSRWIHVLKEKSI